MLKINDIVTWTHPNTGQARTGVIVRVCDRNGSERYGVQVCRQFARRPRHYRPNPAWLKKLR